MLKVKFEVTLTIERDDVFLGEGETEMLEGVIDERLDDIEESIDSKLQERYGSVTPAVRYIGCEP